jgi:hypothetical protein
MMKSTFRAIFAAGALAALAVGSGCVADRPSRNGVFNENQYIRKAFLTTDGTHPDNGWFMNATVTAVSTPNLLGAGFGIYPAALSGPQYVRFGVTSDKLQMINMRQIQANPSDDVIPEVINAWPITNVDLKYRVNLDGEKSNFYEENQELDWQVRQWVKVNFDKNDMSDVAPLGEWVETGLAKCADLGNASATLVPDSFKTYEASDWHQDYMQWTIQVTLPLNFSDATCAAQFQAANSYNGASAIGFGNQYVTFNLMYSMMRAKDLDDPTKDPAAYVPLVIDEKDPIRHKYGLFEIIPINRDPNSQLLAAQQMVTRWNPRKPVTYYFGPEVPYWVVDSFLGHRTYDTQDAFNADTNQLCLVSGCHRTPDGVQDQTNQLLKAAGADPNFTFTFLNYNDATTFGDAAGPAREWGDIRYSFIHWVDDIDTSTGWTGLGAVLPDIRTGEVLGAMLNLSRAPLQEYAFEMDYYLQTLGASQGLGYANANGTPQEWPTNPPGTSGKCTPGQMVPLNPSVVQSNHNANSSLFTKMQQYLGKPAGTYGNLGPSDFVVPQDTDFFNAYYTLMPYAIFRDPDSNPFVIREGGAGIYAPANYWDMMSQEVEFQKIAANIDKGIAPYGDVTGPTGLQNATAFMNHFRDLSINHQQLDFAKIWTTPMPYYDAVSPFSLNQIMAHDSRHCVADPGGASHWQTKEEWVTQILHGYFQLTAFHEFGHTLGLAHNFMGSVDRRNFPVRVDANGKPLTDANGNPQYAMYTNSVMEYDIVPADGFADVQWGPYDKGAIGWAYTNDAPKAGVTPSTKTVTGQVDAKTPWNDKMGFQADGKTEIQLLSCHDEHLTYTPLCRQHDSGTTPSEIIANTIDTYDWNWAFTNFRVYRKFWDNTAYANRPAAVMQDMRRFLMLWIYDWNSGEITDTLRRIGYQPPAGVPALTYYTQLENKFNNELSTANQLVASFHKAIIQQSAGERPVATIYDQFYGDVTQQGIILDKLFAMQYWVGLWPGTNYDPNQAGAYFSSYSDAPDASYQTVAEDAVDSMIGGQYDAFPYFAPLAVSLFAQDTHNPAFTGRISVRNWIGGHVFTRVEDFLSYFRDVATQNNYVSQDIASVAVVTGGHNYTTPPAVVLSGGGGNGATAHAELGGDWVSAVVIDQPGSGYTSPPVVSFVGGGGTGASGTAKVGSVDCSQAFNTCTYDPRPLSDQHNELMGPDKRKWIWAYIPDRNTYVALQKEVNTASYIIVRAYNDDVVYNLDDGAFPGGAYSAELPMKYYLDSFNQYN